MTTSLYRLMARWTLPLGVVILPAATLAADDWPQWRGPGRNGEVMVDLSAVKGPLAVEWFNPRTGVAANGDTIEGGAKRSFKVPFDGHAVLYVYKGDSKKESRR